MHFRGMRRSKVVDWRKDAQRVKMDHPCNMLALLMRRKGTILEKMGRNKEAELIRNQLEITTDDYPNVYQIFQEKLEKLTIDTN